VPRDTWSDEIVTLSEAKGLSCGCTRPPQRDRGDASLDAQHDS
jgi:hypothetical protein